MRIDNHNKSQKAKVLFVGLDVSGGGAERVFINIANSLNSEQIDLRIVYNCPYEKSDIRTDVPVLYFGQKHMRKGLMKLYTEIKSFIPDYIFTTNGTIAWILPILCRVAGASSKIITRVAVTPCEKYFTSWKSKFQEYFSLKQYHKMHLVIAQTEYMRQDIIKNYKMAPEKVKVIRNYIDFNRVQLLANQHGRPSDLKEDNYNIVAVGALYSVKGFDLLIESIAKLKTEIPNIRLYILGDERYEIGYKAFLVQKAKDLGVVEIVNLLGHKSNPYPYFANADLFVLSSRKEGFPNVVLEALSLRTPVVCTDCVDFTEILNESQGVIVSKNDAKALTDGILTAYHTLKKPVTFNYSNFDYNTLFI